MLSNLLTALEYQHGMLSLAWPYHDLVKLNDLTLVLYPYRGMPPLARHIHDLCQAQKPEVRAEVHAQADRLRSLRSEQRSTLKRTGSEVRGPSRGPRSSGQAQKSEVRAEVRAQVKAQKSEVRAEVRAQVKAQKSEVRAEVRAQADRLRSPH